MMTLLLSAGLVKTNGQYENTYTLGLRGIHDYPMEGANSTAERVALMQQTIDDQRDMLRRNINKPIEEIPQVLCTYEEVLDAYHNGLKVPEDVTLLWSDDKNSESTISIRESCCRRYWFFPNNLWRFRNNVVILQRL